MRLPSIVEFDLDQHLDDTVRALLEVRSQDPTYPPPQDVEADPSAFAAWLLDASPFHRWVAELEGRVIGHVLVEPAHTYLRDHLEQVGYVSTAPRGSAELGKFFVSPSTQRHGIGTALFRTAIDHLRAGGYQTALAVLSTSVAAIRFYEREGLRHLGDFDGLHGENRVFVDEHGGRHGHDRRLRHPAAATRDSHATTRTGSHDGQR